MRLNPASTKFKIAEIVEDACDRGHGPRAGQKIAQAEKDRGQHDARDRPGHGQEELGLRALRLFAHLGYAAEEEERDAAHVHPVPPGDEGVPELMEDDGEEQAQRAGDGHAPIRGRVEALVSLPESRLLARLQTTSEPRMSQLQSTLISKPKTRNRVTVFPNIQPSRRFFRPIRPILIQKACQGRQGGKTGRAPEKAGAPPRKARAGHPAGQENIPGNGTRAWRGGRAGALRPRGRLGTNLV